MFASLGIKQRDTRFENLTLLDDLSRMFEGVNIKKSQLVKERM